LLAQYRATHQLHGWTEVLPDEGSGRRANATRLAQKYGNVASLNIAIEAAESDPTGKQPNIFLNDLILLIDMNYNQWEKLLYEEGWL